MLRISFQNGGYHSEFTKTRKYFFITSKSFALDTSVPVDAVLYELWCKLGTFWSTTTNNVKKLYEYLFQYFIYDYKKTILLFLDYHSAPLKLMRGEWGYCDETRLKHISFSFYYLCYIYWDL